MARILTLPNIISIARIPLAVGFLLFEQRLARLFIIAAAALTDFLDGYLARRGRRSRVGAVLDPVTDKTFVVTAIVSLAVNGPLNALELLVMLSRDIAVAIGLAIVLIRRAPMKLSARMPGKVATVVQLAALVALVLTPAARVPTILVVAMVSAVAIWDYGREAVRALRLPERAH